MGCLLFRGSLSIEVSGRAVKVFASVHYITVVDICYRGVTTKRGSTVCIATPVYSGQKNSEHVG